jgi:hypothetical protein
LIPLATLRPLLALIPLIIIGFSGKAFGNGIASKIGVEDCHQHTGDETNELQYAIR